MSEIEDRPTIGERYGVAIGNGAVGEVVLAAGLQRSITGAMLLRLQAEYDMVRGDMERAGQIPARNVERGRSLALEACALEAAALETVEADPEEARYLGNVAKKLRREAEAIRERTPDDIISARAFILIELKTLRATKERVAALALRMAAKRSGVDKEAALKLAGRVLDVYLDPMCHHCDGTGKLGNRYSGDEERTDPQCRGTGSRRDVLGNGAAETTFAAMLYGELQRQAGDAARGMRHAIYGQEEGPDDRVAGALLASLADLRSPAAHED